METQAEFKVKLKTFIGIQKFLMPYKIDKDQISIECNEHFVEELVQFSLDKLTQAFSSKKSLTNMTNVISQQLSSKVKGSWMCLFMPDQVKYSFALPKFRFLKVSFERNDQKYYVLIAQTELEQ